MRVRRLLAALAAMLVSAAAACSRPPVGEAPPAPATTARPPATSAGAPVTTLTLLIHGSSPGLQAVLAAFQAKHPSLKIRTEFIPLDAAARPGYVAGRLRKGDVDIVQVNGMSTYLVHEGLLAPLDKRLEASGVDRAPYGYLVTQLRQGGYLFELPFSIQPQMLVYNPDLFGAAGVEPPPAAGWTWEQFRQTARQVSRGEGETRVWGFSPPLIESLTYNYLQQERIGDAALVASPEEIQAGIGFFHQMISVDRSMPPAEQRDWSNPDLQILARDDFAQGRAAMSVEPVPVSMREGLRWEVAPIPTPLGRPGAEWVTPGTGAIAANSPHPEEAWQFLLFATGPEGAAVLARSGEIPAYRSATVREAWFSRTPSPPPTTELIFRTIWVIPPPAKDPLAGYRRRELYERINRILSGHAPLQ